MDKNTKSIMLIISVVVVLAVIILASQKWWGSSSINSLAIEPRINTLGAMPELHCCIGNNDAMLTVNSCTEPYPTQTQPVRFTDYICLSDTRSSHVCQGQGWGCKYGFDSLTGNDLFVFWCDLATSSGFVDCQNGCDPNTGQCMEGPRTCTEGYQSCCNDANDCVSNTYRPNGNVFECKDNSWQPKEDCSNVILNPKCVEGTYNYAYCNYNKYYCYLSGCSQWTDQNGCDCFNTPEKCEEAALGAERGCYKFGPDSRGTVQFQWLIKGKGDCVNKRGTLVQSLVTKEECEDQNKCGLTSCSACGQGIFNLCGKDECNQCAGKLNCEWTANNWTAGLIGKCQEKIIPCDGTMLGCIDWMMNIFRSKDKQCTDQVVYGNNWFAKLIGAQIKQGQICPVMFIILLCIILSFVLVSIPLIKYLRQRIGK